MEWYIRKMGAQDQEAYLNFLANRPKKVSISDHYKWLYLENPHGEDHSVFIAFAPKDDPKIAISVYVQNAGQGARAAASVAGLMMEKYLTGEVKKTWIEDYLKAGHFIY